nr:hypothetical protein GCM10020093_027200 [Planobispora longispora]
MRSPRGHVATGEWPFAKAYVHAGMVALDGEKMSKSKGNLVFVSRLRQEADPMAIRLALLARHYRADWEWAPGQLASAEVRLARWRSATGLETGPGAEAVLREVRARMSDDLDAPGPWPSSTPGPSGRCRRAAPTRRLPPWSRTSPTPCSASSSDRRASRKSPGKARAPEKD